MNARSRTAPILRWTGSAACLLLALAWLFTTHWRVFCKFENTELALGWSAILVKHRSHSLPAGGDRWIVQKATEQLADHPWIERYTIGEPEFDPVSRSVIVVDKRCTFIPLWIPFVAVAIPTFVLWHRNHRPPPGRCRKCGYDLTANVSGVCPECGANI